jgi:hypothetical protein
LLHNVGDAAIEVPDHAVCLRVAGRRQAMLEVQRQARFVEDMLTRSTDRAAATDAALRPLEFDS